MQTIVKLGDARFILTEGDITEIEVEAIVNPANEKLVLGGGVAGAIRSRGGPKIQEECNRLGGTKVGNAVITTGGDLFADYVIHAVGPRMGEGEEDRKLRDATLNSLLVAESRGIKSIAFPAISTGIFGYPVDRCAKIMTTVCIEYLKRPTKIKEVHICLWGRDNFEVFRDQLIKLIGEPDFS